MKKCIDCGKKIDKRSKRCKSCNKKGNRCNFYKLGRPKCIICNKEITYNQKHCQSCAAKERYKVIENNPNFKGGYTLIKPKCQDCGKELNDYRNKRCDKCFRKFNKGINHASFGKPAPHGKGSYYKNIWMRSSWEIIYAKYLTKNHIKWQYEPKAFDLGNTTYTPDFYLPEKDIYVEIKGYWRDDAKSKFRLFKDMYKEKIIVVNEKIIKQLIRRK